MLPRLLLVVPVAMLASGCRGWQSALDPHAVQADTLSHLILGMVAVCTVVFVLVVAVLLMALLRRRPPREPTTAVDAARERRMASVIAVAMGATLLVVVGLTVASFVATRRITANAPDALVIQVRGWQWWWEVTYPDARPDRQFSTANEIHVPVGRPVRIELAAADVIHSFWVPNLAGKQDMIPGRDNSLAFTADKPGTYRGQCAEFCGLQHAHMAILVIAEEPAAFEAWRTAQVAEARPPSDPEQAAGRHVFLARQCSACHAIRGTAAAASNGPDLTHVGGRRTIAAGLFDTTRGSLAAWIADPQTLKPGNNMPMVDLPADDLRAVSAYLESLQ